MIISPWVRRHMVFRSPDGADGGGSTAVAEPPMGSVGDAYTDALTKARGETPPDRTPPAATGPAATGPASTGATGPAASGATGASGPAASGSTGATGPAKPATALDSLLDGATGPTGATGPGATGASGPTDENPFLKELPETLPREGRGEHWAKARGAIDTQGKTISQLNKTVADVTRQLEEARANPSGSQEVADLKKQLDEYKDAIVAINVDFDPAHRAKFVDGRAAIVSKAATKLIAFGGDGPALEKALSMPESRARTTAIKEAMGDVDPVDQGRILSLVADVDKLDDEKAEIMKDPQGAWDKLQKAQKDAAIAAGARQEQSKAEIFQNVSKTLPEKFFLLRKVDDSLPDAAAHNADVDQMAVDAFKLLGADAKPEDLVEAAYAKHLVPKLQDFLKTSRAELRTALAALKEYEEASPGFKGGKAQEKTGLDAALEKSPGDIYKESLRKSAGQD